MKHSKTILGVGQTGSKLASMFANGEDTLLTFNTDQRDSGGILVGKDYLITNGGAGQNYTRGLKIWAENKDKLEKYLEPVVDQNIVYFISGGGGSGSSSAITFLNILTRQSNRILLVVVAPFLKESIPATTNATRLLSRTAEFSNNISVLLISNDDIAKETDSLSFDKINRKIVEKVHMITDLIDYHDDTTYTPFALDEGDHRSVVYSGGFITVSHDDLEAEMDVNGPKLPRFPYGKLKEATNVLVAKYIPAKFNREVADLEGDKLLQVAMKISGSAKGARILHGAIRADITFPKYTVIAAGLKIDKIFNKMKTKATDAAVMHLEKKNLKAHKILESKEERGLDI